MGKNVNVAGAPGKKIEATGTRVGSDGTGYFRGNDGKYYYGNPKNGYVTETIQSKKADEERLAAEQAAHESYAGVFQADLAASTKASLLEAFLLFILTTVIVLRAIVILTIGLVLMLAVMAWPWYINMLAGFYMSGRGDWSVILMTVILVALIGYFVLCVRKVLAGKCIRSLRYIIVCAAAMVMPFVLYGILTGDLGQVTSNGLWGLVLGVIPALVLTYLEHAMAQEARVGIEWFGFRIARLLCRVCPYNSIGMFLIGAVMIVLSVLTFTLLQTLMAAAMLTVMGIIMILIGLVPMLKKEP